MTHDLEDFGQWRDSVETRLVKLEVTVGEQARLRAAMDEDLSKLHVERKLLERVHVGVEAIRDMLDRNQSQAS